MASCLCGHSSFSLVSITLVVSQLGNQHKNTPLSVWSVYHDGTYIVFYIIGHALYFKESAYLVVHSGVYHGWNICRSGRGIMGVDLIGGRENIRGEMKNSINWLRLWIKNKNQSNARLVNASFHIESKIVSNQYVDCHYFANRVIIKPTNINFVSRWNCYMFCRLKQHWISYKLRETPHAIVLRDLRKNLTDCWDDYLFLVFTTCRPQSRQNKRYCNCNKGSKQSPYFMARKYMFMMNHICCSVNMYAEILLPCHYWNAVCYDVMCESVSRISYHDDVDLKKMRSLLSD